jgi:hypothetical protein
MTHERDIERILGHWLADGPTEVPDRVMDVIADRIVRQPQRRAWRLDWRDSNMHTSLRAAAVLAAVVILAVGAIYLRGSPSGSNIGGPAVTPSPSPTASPTPAPSPSSFASVTFQPVVHVTSPAGWSVEDGDRTFLLNPPAGGSVAGRSIGLMSGPFVTFKDSACENQAPAAVGTSVANLIASVSGDPRLVATTPQAITISGHVGQMIDIGVAPSWTGTCDWSAGKGAVLIVSATTTGPAFGTGGTGRDRYIFLDVEGSVVAIDIGTPEGTDFETFLAEAMPIVQSMRFTP